MLVIGPKASLRRVDLGTRTVTFATPRYPRLSLVAVRPRFRP